MSWSAFLQNIIREVLIPAGLAVLGAWLHRLGINGSARTPPNQPPQPGGGA